MTISRRVHLLVVLTKFLVRLGGKTMKSFVLKVMVEQSNLLVVKMTPGRLGGKTMEFSVAVVAVEQSNWLMVKMTQR